jgi:hypothetical protein
MELEELLIGIWRWLTTSLWDCFNDFMKVKRWWSDEKF